MDRKGTSPLLINTRCVSSDNRHTLHATFERFYRCEREGRVSVSRTDASFLRTGCCLVITGFACSRTSEEDGRRGRPVRHMAPFPKIRRFPSPRGACNAAQCLHQRIIERPIRIITFLPFRRSISIPRPINRPVFRRAFNTVSVALLKQRTITHGTKFLRLGFCLHSPGTKKRKQLEKDIIEVEKSNGGEEIVRSVPRLWQYSNIRVYI